MREAEEIFRMIITDRREAEEIFRMIITDRREAEEIFRMIITDRREAEEIFRMIITDRREAEEIFRMIITDRREAEEIFRMIITDRREAEEIFRMIITDRRDMLQTTQPTSGGAVTADSSCCANCVEPPRPQQWGPDLPFLSMRTRWRCCSQKRVMSRPIQVRQLKTRKSGFVISAINKYMSESRYP